LLLSAGGMVGNIRSYTREDVIFDLEQPIKMHVKGQRKKIRPRNNLIINAFTERYIKTFEKAPRDIAAFKKLIEAKKVTNEDSRTYPETEKIITKLDSLETTLAFVTRTKEIKPLDGLTY
jgi:hypothetical protein